MGDTVAVKGLEFEETVLSCLIDLGWSANKTKLSGDYGADIVASFGNEILVIQCKDYAESKSIGVSAIQETFSAKSFYGATNAALIYRGRLSRNAISLALKVSVEIIHFSRMVPGCPIDRVNDRKSVEEFKRKKRLEEKIKLGDKFNDELKIWKMMQAILGESEVQYNAHIEYHYRNFIKESEDRISELSSGGILSKIYNTHKIDSEKKKLMTFVDFRWSNLRSGYRKNWINKFIAGTIDSKSDKYKILIDKIDENNVNFVEQFYEFERNLKRLKAQILGTDIRYYDGLKL